MRIGADYYPEHWEKERWKTDAEMMVKANIKVIMEIRSSSEQESITALTVRHTEKKQKN